MSDLEKKARIFSNTEGNQSSKLMREVEYDTGRYVGYLAGFKDCEKEYEEKLRWIPVEEKLPEISKESDIYSDVVTVREHDYYSPLAALYSYEYKQWISYPNSVVLSNVTEWRPFL